MAQPTTEETTSKTLQKGDTKPDKRAGLRQALLASGVEFTESELNYISNNLMSAELRDAIDREDENDTLYALGIALGGDLVGFGLGLGVFSSDAWTSMLAREQDIDRKLRTNQFISKGIKRAMRESAIRPFKALQAERTTRTQATMAGGQQPVTSKAIAASAKDDSIAEAMGSTIAQQNAAIIKAELSERTRLEKEGKTIDATKLAMWEKRVAEPGGKMAKELSKGLLRLYASKQKEDIEYAVSVMRAAGMSNSEILVALNKSRTLKGKGQTEWLLNEVHKRFPESETTGDAPPVASQAPGVFEGLEGPGVLESPVRTVQTPQEIEEQRAGTAKTVRDWMESMPLPVGGMAGEPTPEAHYDVQGEYRGPVGREGRWRREGEGQEGWESRRKIPEYESFGEMRGGKLRSAGRRAQREWIRANPSLAGRAKDVWATESLWRKTNMSNDEWQDFLDFADDKYPDKAIHQIPAGDYEEVLSDYDVDERRGVRERQIRQMSAGEYEHEVGGPQRGPEGMQSLYEMTPLAPRD